MQLKSKWFFWAVAAAAFARLFSMAVMPLIDPSEPRYAEIARVMAQTNDWVTPWFEPGVPFWGKPPLSFWAQALGFKLLGVSEFAVRFPSFLAMAALALLMYRAAKLFAGQEIARWAVFIFVSMLLPLTSAGAILTDPFFALGVGYALLAFLVAPIMPTLFWRYGFFVGLAIGLLSKGPLTLVLAGGTIMPWLVLSRDRMRYLKSLPWLTGTLLMLALVIPWYVLAELKTPGFLQYFIVGEHFQRFVDSGWKGDLYGTAHNRPLGAIWRELLLASFPWGPLGLVMAGWALWAAPRRETLRSVWRQPAVPYLTLWALVAPGFFTLSGNILWTYVLPSLPALALILAMFGKELLGAEPRPRTRRGLAAGFAVAPMAAVALGLVSLVSPTQLKTEKQLVAAAEARMADGQKLYFVDSPSFSGRFYTRGTAETIGFDALEKLVAPGGETVFLAIPKGDEDQVSPQVLARLQPIYESRKYRLYEAGKGLPVSAR